MHCFGHIHEGYGAEVVAWKPVTSEVNRNGTSTSTIDSHNGGGAAAQSISQADVWTRIPYDQRSHNDWEEQTGQCTLTRGYRVATRNMSSEKDQRYS